LWVPRQNGKGDVIMALELYWLFVLKVPLIVHSAHEYKTAQEAWIRITGVINSTPWLKKRVKRIWKANGEQGVELLDDPKTGEPGPRLRFMARTAGAGRGFSAAKLILDEAQELTEDMMRAILFVMSAQQDPQIWFFGTPPKEDDAWIYNLKETGEAAAPGVAWFDTGMETIDTNDRNAVEILKSPGLWYETNPSLGIKRSNGTGLRRSAVEKELRLLGPGSAFAMERCGMWLPRAREEGDASIDPAKWAKLAKAVERPTDVVIAFHVNPRRTHATIMFVGKILGKWRVGLVASKPGVGWLTPKLVDIKEKWNPIAFVVDAKSEATIEELAQRGIKLPEDPEKPKRGDLAIPTMGEVATGYGLLIDAANDDMIGHHDDSALNVAVTAPPRPLGGGSTFDHKRGIEVGPAVSVQVGMWAYRDRFDAVTSGDDYDPLANIW
jgi:hypothetical protein